MIGRGRHRGVRLESDDTVTLNLDAMRAALPKGVSLVKDSAEKLYATTQEVSGVLVKSGEAFGQLLKGSVEAANDTVGKATTKTGKRASA